MVQRVRATGKFFLLPVKNGAEKVTIQIGRPGEANSYPLIVELGRADDYTFFGCGVTPVTVGECLEYSAPEGCRIDWQFTDHFPESPDRNQAPERARLHFSASRGWINDPNGLAYFDDAYHLFYQHNPFGTGWNNMHWGHARSTDLMHWVDGPDMLAPDQFGSMFSGSTVIDERNVSGLGDGVTPPVLLYYTADKIPNATQCMAFSRDGGRHFEKYAGNPIIATTADARDPSIVYDEHNRLYVMAFYLGDHAPVSKQFAFFTSRDLLNWQDTGKTYSACDRECPGIYWADVEEEPWEQVRMIFHSADGFYQIGDFDGKCFRPESEALRYYPRASEGGHAYAGQCFYRTPDGRRVFIAWLTPRENPPSLYYNCLMTLPVEFCLRRFSEGLRIAVRPVRELEELVDFSVKLPRVAAESPVEAELASAPSGVSWEIAGTLPENGVVRFTAGGVSWCYHAATRKLEAPALSAVLPEGAGRTFRLIYDIGAMELFAADGRVWMPRNLGAADVFAPVLTVTEGELVDVTLRHYRSIWC